MTVNILKWTEGLIYFSYSTGDCRSELNLENGQTKLIEDEEGNEIVVEFFFC